MEVKHIDWTGRELTFALVAEAKHTFGEDVMSIVCAPQTYNALAVQGFGARTYTAPGGKLSDSQYQDGDIIWTTTLGVPDDVLILSNLDKIVVFSQFKSGLFKRKEDQMPLYRKMVAAA